MIWRARKRPSDQQLTAWMEGELTRSESAAVAAELEQSSEARARLRQLRQIRSTLAAPIPFAEQVDLVAALRDASERPEPPARSLARRPFLPAAAAAAALVAAGGWAISTWPRSHDAQSEFRAKGGGAATSKTSRWAGVQVFRVREGAPPVPLGPSLKSGEQLLFSYTNLGASPYPFLMIFAIDAAHEVRWFYPAYERADTDPSSMAIAPQQSAKLLPDVVGHDYALGPMSVYALFTLRELHVSEVERWLASLKFRPKEGPSADTQLIALPVEVVR